MRDWFRIRHARRLTVRSNEDWIEALRGRDERGLTDLRVVLVEALRPVLRRKTPRQSDALAEDFAQDALLHILERLDTFRGEARFTTWAAKVAVRLALSELRRLRWKDVSLDELLSERPDGLGTAHADDPTPDAATMSSERVELVRSLVAEALTDRQRTAIEAVMLRGMPIEEVARRMETNRNALYKLLHDARQRLKRALEERGLSADDLLTEEF